VLLTHSYDDTAKHRDLYDFVGLLRGFAVMLCLAVGLVWLVRMMKYFIKVSKDTALNSALLRDYAENVLPREGIFIQRRIRTALIFFGVFALLSADFRLDGVNVIPDLFAAIAFMVSVLILKGHLPQYKRYIAVSAFYGTLSLVHFVFETIFFDTYTINAIVRSDEAYSFYLVVIALTVLKAVGFVFTSLCLVGALRSIIDGHTGFSVSSLPYGVSDRINALHKELNQKMTFPIIASILLCVADVFCVLSARMISFTVLINNVFVLLFFVAVSYVANEVFDEVKAKYMLA
jgi:hypothetical protein